MIENTVRFRKLLQNISQERCGTDEMKIEFAAGVYFAVRETLICAGMKREEALAEIRKYAPDLIQQGVVSEEDEDDFFQA